MCCLVFINMNGYPHGEHPDKEASTEYRYSPEAHSIAHQPYGNKNDRPHYNNGNDVYIEHGVVCVYYIKVWSFQLGTTASRGNLCTLNDWRMRTGERVFGAYACLSCRIGSFSQSIIMKKSSPDFFIVSLIALLFAGPAARAQSWVTANEIVNEMALLQPKSCACVIRDTSHRERKCNGYYTGRKKIYLPTP